MTSARPLGIVRRAGGRISVVPLGPGEGLLQEALSSLYSPFATTHKMRFPPDRGGIGYKE